MSKRQLIIGSHNPKNGTVNKGYVCGICGKLIILGNKGGHMIGKEEYKVPPPPKKDVAAIFGEECILALAKILIDSMEKEAEINAREEEEEIGKN